MSEIKETPESEWRQLKDGDRVKWIGHGINFQRIVFNDYLKLDKIYTVKTHWDPPSRETWLSLVEFPQHGWPKYLFKKAFQLNYREVK